MSNLSITEKSATRVDLAGGTLDLWPLSTLVKGSTTVNCSIDCYTTVKYERSNSNPDGLEVKVESPDFSESFNFPSLSEFNKTTDSKLTLLKAAVAVLEGGHLKGSMWTISSESPAGSGLGGSSSLMISLMKVMFKLNNWPFDEKSLVECAKNAETQVLKTPAGIQDYFSPIKKGLNKISFLESGFKRESLDQVLDFWQPCLTIVDSQIKHHSGMNNWDILKNYIDGDQKTVEALNEVSQISKNVAEALVSKNVKALSECFDQELGARKKVSDSYVNSELQEFLNKLTKLCPSIKALKICGAGGGGCVLLLHEASEKEEITKTLKNGSVSVLPFSLTRGIN